jgi:hypothetical protein
MIYYVSYLKDRLANNYLGLNIPHEIVEPYLNELESILGEDDFKVFTDLQKQRDGGKYHITVINVADYNRLTKELGLDKFVNSLELIFHYEIDDLRMMGIGTAFQNDNRSYFIVCKSEKLDAIRSRFGLPSFDFHVTLGFKFKDVFGVRKNEVLKKESNFLQLLKAEFYKNDNWQFIRKIKSFDLPQTSEIIPVEISETRMKVKCSGYYLDVTYMEDGENFAILTKYPITEELPRLSETEIAKILNKK